VWHEVRVWRWYATKVVRAIFAERQEAIIVVTVYTYYQ